MEEGKKKKGLFSMIKESMNKTGGCSCGPGDACYVDPEADQKALEALLKETETQQPPEKSK